MSYQIICDNRGDAPTTSAPLRIPSTISQHDVARFLAAQLHLDRGLYLWNDGFDPAEVRASVEARWTPRAWQRIRKQAWRIAAGGAT